MHSDWMQLRLTEDERAQFERVRYFLVEDAISSSIVERANEAIERLARGMIQDEGLADDARFNYLDFIGKGDVYMELPDWPSTFPKVWDILGWNIQLFHSHLIYTPPQGPDGPDPGYNWHMDCGRLNQGTGTGAPAPYLAESSLLSDRHF